MTADELRDLSADPEAFTANAFSVLQGAADLLATAAGPEEAAVTREIIIQCREQRETVDEATGGLVDALVRELGLFPYLDGGALDDRDLLARETLRVDGVAVMHTAQAAVYARLMAGDNIVLSAPTSFGKSLIIDVLLASGRFDNVLVVVPTLALIDETRRRLATRKTGHKVVTHPTQPVGDRNVFVLTGERMLEMADLPTPDLFVLDEFYKLGDGDERAQILNQVFYDMRRKGVQYYLLGPNVHGLGDGVPGALRDEFQRSDDVTVALRFHDVPVPGEREAALIDLCRRLQEMTLVYCQSPESAHKTARELLKAGVGAPEPGLQSAADWVAEHFHPDWVVVEALRHGIGVHHGQLPRALGQFMVKAFEDGRIKFLLATGTLIEGVNTHARHVVVYDPRRPGNKKMDAFTFRNISGRCGRMFHHFSGDVWLFGKRPSDELPEVDIPILSQGDDVPPSLLQHVDLEDLSDRARERLEPFQEQTDLSEGTLRANVGLDLDGQIALARALRANPARYHGRLSFRASPRYEQLLEVCRLLWTHLGSRPLSSTYTRSYNQLARQLMNFSIKGSAKALIDEAVAQEPTADIDKLVTDVCRFVRNIAGYSFPVRLRALDRIQREVFTSVGMTPGDYSSYVARVEGLFLDMPLVALDEYGLPPELAVKLRAQLRPDGDLDGVLARLEALTPRPGALSPFEAELLAYAQAGL
ncbi:MAG: helicase protein [Solirubrobacterales bacterium]|nr:helicase protein [Solirubrobacterales bacterium]